jgi:uncharacterized protein YukE
LWITALLLLISSGILIIFLLKPKQNSGVLQALSIADLTSVISLAVNAALFVITIISLVIAVAAYREAESSGREQQKTLDASRIALQQTSETLQHSAEHFRTTAQSAAGQYELLELEKREREKAVLSTLTWELTFNASAVVDDLKIIGVEQDALKQEKSIITPLRLLQTQAWELLRVYMPPALNHAVILTEVTGAYNATFTLNELIRSREEYRLHNGAMSNFGTRMVAYDQTIQQNLTRLAASIDKLRIALGKEA